MLNYDKVVDGLQRLLDGEIPNKKTGICANLQHLLRVGFDDAFFCVYKMAEHWNKYSGDMNYPIVDLSKPSLSAESQYYDSIGGCRLWVSTQGELRRELIQFMLDNPQLLRNVIDEVNNTL